MIDEKEGRQKRVSRKDRIRVVSREGTSESKARSGMKEKRRVDTTGTATYSYSSDEAFKLLKTNNVVSKPDQEKAKQILIDLRSSGR